MEQQDEPSKGLRIEIPCHKAWNELSGSGDERWCTTCARTVIDAASLTPDEACRIAETTPGGACMRLTMPADEGAGGVENLTAHEAALREIEALARSSSDVPEMMGLVYTNPVAARELPMEQGPPDLRS